MDAIQTEPNEYHWQNGITFTRMADGSVRIRQWFWYDGIPTPCWLPTNIATIPAGEWASIKEATNIPVRD